MIEYFAFFFFCRYRRWLDDLSRKKWNILLSDSAPSNRLSLLVGGGDAVCAWRQAASSFEADHKGSLWSAALHLARLQVPERSCVGWVCVGGVYVGCVCWVGVCWGWRVWCKGGSRGEGEQVLSCDPGAATNELSRLTRSQVSARHSRSVFPYPVVEKEQRVKPSTRATTIYRAHILLHNCFQWSSMRLLNRKTHFHFSSSCMPAHNNMQYNKDTTTHLVINKIK